MSSTPKSSHFQTPRGSGGMNTPSIAHANSAIRNVNKRKRTAFKGSLDSPFDIRWPFVPAQEQAEILEMALALFSPVGEFRRAQLVANSKPLPEKNAGSCTPKASKRKFVPEAPVTPRPNAKPKQIDGIVFGLREVTKCLEYALKSLSPSNTQDIVQARAGLRMVFVCKADVHPSILVNHLLMLAAQAGVVIFPLGKNAEQALALALGVTRVTAVGIKEGTPAFDQLMAAAASKVSKVDPNWMVGKETPPEKPVEAL
ncbi:hypothetical protein K493DRAFT_315434 [Basidiobolus meristosporus CBS 931.73]|uniref:Ribosomal protein L7Ae/L30e/S12e/Gadd45 domain-containing protein n=1 Tax=Basidiobolus meristosporus CBS 931.73 TaxID=1314790 RepID=A0A1Y1Y9B7_9FUNG|nr:hypothetical protein K493DRAFT_315434 [Basidiobolus meristosporus CBS 931.73]|eukprot:ORX94587.1 hypothetical protein K493DRAFT_315434 [Basidiobolus meristosporus CBS 931.73]